MLKQRKKAPVFTELRDFAQDGIRVVGIVLISAITVVLCEAIIAGMIWCCKKLSGYQVPHYAEMISFGVLTITMLSLVFFGLWTHIKGLAFCEVEEEQKAEPDQQSLTINNDES